MPRWNSTRCAVLTSDRSLTQLLWLPFVSAQRRNAAPSASRSAMVSSSNDRPVWISSRSATRSAVRLTMWPP